MSIHQDAVSASVCSVLVLLCFSQHLILCASPPLLQKGDMGKAWDFLDVKIDDSAYGDSSSSSSSSSTASIKREIELQKLDIARRFAFLFLFLFLSFSNVSFFNILLIRSSCFLFADCKTSIR
jgi:hypothetical protein